MKFKALPIIIGSFICLSSLWIGSYFAHIYPHGTWQSLPIFLTTIAAIIFGVFVINLGVK